MTRITIAHTSCRTDTAHGTSPAQETTLPKPSQRRLIGLFPNGRGNNVYGKIPGYGLRLVACRPDGFLRKQRFLFFNKYGHGHRHWYRHRHRHRHRYRHGYRHGHRHWYRHGHGHGNRHGYRHGHKYCLFLCWKLLSSRSRLLQLQLFHWRDGRQLFLYGNPDILLLYFHHRLRRSAFVQHVLGNKNLPANEHIHHNFKHSKRHHAVLLRLAGGSLFSLDLLRRGRFMGALHTGHYRLRQQDDANHHDSRFLGFSVTAETNKKALALWRGRRREVNKKGAADGRAYPALTRLCFGI